MTPNQIVFTFLVGGGILLPIIATFAPYRHMNKVSIASVVYVLGGALAYGWAAIASAKVTL
jgi:hypothetical protein